MLFDAPLADIRAYIGRAEASGELRRMTPTTGSTWRADEPQVVLRQSTGLELGSTSAASLGLLLWHGSEPSEDAVLLVGPDLAEAGGGAAPVLAPPAGSGMKLRRPFAQVICVRVRGGDDEVYQRYRDMREARQRVALRGVMWRTLPRQQSIWCRIDRASLAEGLDARTLGSAFVHEMRALPFVEAVQVLMVTAGQAAVEQLRPAAAQVLDIVDALTRMHEETMELDCDSCEYEAICDAADELRRIHRRLSQRSER